MKFSEILDGVRAGPDGFVARSDETWAHGRTTFGGLQGALLVRAMRKVADTALLLRTLQVTFMAPVPVGPLSVRAQVARAGKNTVHVAAQIVADLSRLPLHGWRLDAEATVAVDGYTSQSIQVWGPDQSLVALSRQTMVVFG